jgi:hypothetical protein
MAKERPVASEEIAEEGAFGDDEEQASNGSDDMTAGIEEKELYFVSFVGCQRCERAYLGDDECLDQHDNAARNNRSKGNDIQSAHDVEDDVSWSCQVLG